MKKKSVKTKKNPDLIPVSDEMRRWCALLADEVIRWPGVTSRKMFGMNALYRGGVIFAAVSDKRALISAHSIIFKMQQPTKAESARLAKDSRTKLHFGIGQKWFGYEIHEDHDLTGALDWLAVAYDHARKAPPKKKRN